MMNRDGYKMINSMGGSVLVELGDLEVNGRKKTQLIISDTFTGDVLIVLSLHEFDVLHTAVGEIAAELDKRYPNRMKETFT